MRIARRRMQISGSSGGAHLLNLSLFLMLLAFFIVLNSVSSFDESKYRPILENLQMTFASTVQPSRETATSVTPNPLQSINEGETIDRIEALFNAQISGFSATKSGSRGVMVVRVSLEEFDRAVTSPGQIDVTRTQSAGTLQTFFVPTLISLIQAKESGAPYRMDMIFHTADSPALLYNSDPRALEEARRQAALYAGILERAGLDADVMGLAIMQGDPQFLTLSFRPIDAGRS